MPCPGRGVYASPQTIRVPAAASPRLRRRSTSRRRASPQTIHVPAAAPPRPVAVCPRGRGDAREDLAFRQERLREFRQLLPDERHVAQQRSGALRRQDLVVELVRRVGRVGGLGHRVREDELEDRQQHPVRPAGTVEAGQGPGPRPRVVAGRRAGRVASRGRRERRELGKGVVTERDRAALEDDLRHRHVLASSTSSPRLVLVSARGRSTTFTFSVRQRPSTGFSKSAIRKK